MPVVIQVGSLVSPPTNAYGLVQYVAQRVPGYDASEYLRELNSAYIHVWEEVSKLKNDYFSAIKTVTVATNGAQVFDLLFNLDGALSDAISPRLYQVTRVRVQPPAGGLFQTSKAMNFNDPDYLAIEANPSATPTQTGPYYWTLFGRGQLKFGLPLAAATVLEITYSFWPLALVYDSTGTVSSAGSTVTGVSTTFRSALIQPDFLAYAPAASASAELIAMEFVCNVNQVYRVVTTPTDIALTTAATIAPALAGGSAYVLAVQPDIPREHIRVIASVALRNMYSLAGDDSRVAEWTAIAASNMQMMKDSLIERQGQDPPRKGRFPYGVSRRNRAFLR